MLAWLLMLLCQLPVDAGPRLPTIGYEHFCWDNPAMCSGIVPVSRDTSRIADIAAINRAVNRAITYQSETVDVWTLNPTHGDCDDYAVTKLARLLALGIPRTALRLALYREHGIPHAVLLASTPQGVFVLSNLSDRLIPITSRRFDWIAGEAFSSYGFAALRKWH